MAAGMSCKEVARPHLLSASTCDSRIFFTDVKAKSRNNDVCSTANAEMDSSRFLYHGVQIVGSEFCLTFVIFVLRFVFHVFWFEV